MSVDVDDVGALCVAHTLADLGEARLLAVTHDTGLPTGVGAVSAIGAIVAISSFIQTSIKTNTTTKKTKKTRNHTEKKTRKR